MSNSTQVALTEPALSGTPPHEDNIGISAALFTVIIYHVVEPSAVTHLGSYALPVRDHLPYVALARRYKSGLARLN